MAAPMREVTVTMIGERPLGTTWEKIMPRWDIPMAVAASTNSWFRTTRTDDLVILINSGMAVTPTARMRLGRLCPKTVTITMPSRRVGMEARKSEKRMIRSSTRPPKYPAIEPRINPTMREMETPPRPMRRE